ncbi:MAG: 50S ribosomal protein L10 [Candidatus Liptonbacteria bacterium]|nr:50S ribosomal protein L10 [Candidatus Liptonbacteria bacterium]
MKTKAQKQEELKKGKELLEKSSFLIFTDFTRVSSEQLRRIRQAARNVSARFMVIKKRLLGVLLKEKGMEFNAGEHKVSLGTVFAPDIEQGAGVVYRTMKELGIEKEKILGGYDLKGNIYLSAEEVIAVGSLPPREVLLAQLLGMLAAPIRSFLYVLKEKSNQPAPQSRGDAGTVGNQTVEQNK